METKTETHPAAPVKQSMAGTGTCRVCGQPVSSKVEGHRGVYRHI
jgi:hypothetical protein